MSARYTGGLVYNAPGGWSGFFDGSGDYLSFATNQTPLLLSSSDFTFEAWVYRSSGTSTAVVFCGQSDLNTVGGSGYVFYVSSSASSDLYIGGSGYGISSPNPSVGAWAHVAWARTGGTYSSYLNGARVATRSDLGTGAVNNGATNYAPSIGAFSNSGSPLTGYISNARLIKGSGGYDATQSTITIPSGPLNAVTNTSLLTCRYPTFVDGSTNNFTITVNGNTAVSTVNPFPTSQLPNPALGGAGNGVYTMSQYAALKAANLWPAYDPYYKNVTLNLHGNAGAVLPFNTDASTNNFQVTQVGDTRPSNWTPFITDGYWSNAFDGSGDWLTAPSNAGFGFGTGDFTIEGWLYWIGGSGENTFFCVDVTSGANIFLSSGGNWGIGTRALVINNNFGTPPTKNVWHHIAVSRSGSTIYAFIDGALVFSGANTSNYATGSPGIAAIPTVSSNIMSGYISNLRVVKGTAVYTSAFTPSTTPLTAISGTSLLTCQSNRFIDNSANAFTITPSGNTAVNPFQPFTAPTGTSAYGSGYFDGSGDRLTAAYNSAFILTADFSIEMFVYPISHNSYGGLIAFATPTNPWTGWYLIFYSTTNQILVGLNNTDVYTSTASLTMSAWNHVALCRTGSTVALFINGVRDGTVTNSGSFDSGGFPLYIGVERQLNAYTLGYFSDVRVIKGSNPYGTGATITVPTSPLTAITNTSLLTVQTNAPSQNNTFLDSSTNNFVITRNGNTTQGTFTPYGSNWSTYFTGSSTYLYFANNAALSFGTGDFCVEAWVYKQRAANEPIIDSRATNNASPWAVYIDGSNLPYFYEGTSYTSTIAITLNAWTHVAVTRSSGTLRIFVNGVQGYSATVTTNLDRSGGNQVIGATVATFANSWSGYMSNFRIVKGSAVYTSAFTPPTAPLTAISGTSLLTFQSNRFVDNSSNAFTFTIVGSPSVQRFSPFSPTTAYSTSVIGGSGYFSGTSASVVTTNTVTTVGTQDFCVEAWVYCLSTTNYACIVGNDNAASGLALFIEMGTTRGIFLGGPEVTLTSPIYNQWVHIAYSRVSGTYAGWVNGTRLATGSFTSNLSNAIKVGVNNYAAISTSGYGTTGYIADARLVVGSSPYSPSSTTITVPTAPLTAISNTVFLASMTNAGILDNAMMNDLETAGSAQISTSVKKYGTGSMYFDGSTGNLVGQYNQIYSFGTGDFTVEGWFYFTDLNTTQRGLVALGDGANGSGPIYNAWTLVYRGTEGSNQLRFYRYDGTEYSYDTSGLTLVANTWTHIAVCRSSGTLKIFVNGVSYYSATVTQSFAAVNTNPLRVALQYYGPPSGYNGPRYWPGYIDDLRITKGVARYTTTFTPPTSQLQDQ